MAVFQLGDVPTGFVFDESGEHIHYKYGLLLAIPQPNQASPATWGDAYFSLGSSWADVRLRVQLHNGTNWLPSEDWDVNQNNGRRGMKLPQGIQKVHVGRMKKSSADFMDDNPVGWLLEHDV